MIGAREVEAVASESGFRGEAVEKVLRLLGILGRLDRHEATRGAWVLKGGTALNLFCLDVPRLSVDIDLNYVGAGGLVAMQRARPVFERALAACCEREGCAVRRTPTEHAGGKFRLRFPSVLGGSQNLEVDVSYVARVPLWETEHRRTRFPAGSDLDVPVLTLEELAAGKFAALMQRSVARDAYDAANLLQLAPDLPLRERFRIAFVCQVASSRSDIRQSAPSIPELDSRVVERELLPLLRLDRAATPANPRQLREWVVETVSSSVRSMLAWSTGERRFLDRLLDDGEIDADALSDDPVTRDRIRKQPMLLWKARHVRKHRGKE